MRSFEFVDHTKKKAICHGTVLSPNTRWHQAGCVITKKNWLHGQYFVSYFMAGWLNYATTKEDLIAPNIFWAGTVGPLFRTVIVSIEAARIRDTGSQIYLPRDFRTISIIVTTLMTSLRSIKTSWSVFCTTFLQWCSRYFGQDNIHCWWTKKKRNIDVPSTAIFGQAGISSSGRITGWVLLRKVVTSRWIHSFWTGPSFRRIRLLRRHPGGRHWLRCWFPATV